MEISGLNQTPLARVLGAQADGLAPLVKELHLGSSQRKYHGRVTVSVGKGLGRLAARLAGFPPAMTDAPFSLEITPTEKNEKWTRHFGEHVTTSFLTTETGRLLERFGPVTTVLLPSVQPNGGLSFSTGRAWGFFVPLPVWISPKGLVKVAEVTGRYEFDIFGELPVVGRVISYEGWLAPVTA